jgi:hypothetical protein
VTNVVAAVTNVVAAVTNVVAAVTNVTMDLLAEASRLRSRGSDAALH